MTIECPSSEAQFIAQILKDKAYPQDPNASQAELNTENLKTAQTAENFFSTSLNQAPYHPLGFFEDPFQNQNVYSKISNSSSSTSLGLETLPISEANLQTREVPKKSLPITPTMRANTQPLNDQFNTCPENTMTNTNSGYQVSDIPTDLQTPIYTTSSIEYFNSSSSTAYHELTQPASFASPSMQSISEVSSSPSSSASQANRLSADLLRVQRDFITYLFQQNLVINQQPATEQLLYGLVKSFDSYYEHPHEYSNLFETDEKFHGPDLMYFILICIRLFNDLELKRQLLSIESEQSSHLAKKQETTRPLWPKPAQRYLLYALACESEDLPYKGKVMRIANRMSRFGYTYKPKQITSRIQTFSKQYKKDPTIFWNEKSKYIEKPFLRAFINMYQLSGNDPLKCPTPVENQTDKFLWNKVDVSFALEAYIAGESCEHIATRFQTLKYRVETSTVEKKLRRIYYQYKIRRGGLPKLFPDSLTDILYDKFIQKYEQNKKLRVITKKPTTSTLSESNI